jgi:hypothetical protein
MQKDEVRNTLKKILIDHFLVDSKLLKEEKPLDRLHDNFRILGYLIFLEQLINKEYNAKIPLLESVSAAIHTPEDIVLLIIKELGTNKVETQNDLKTT